MNNKRSKPLIPVTVLTGFLGSGKTTILSRILRQSTFTNTAVIVNEFGEVGLDHLLVESSDENIVDLSCGCICCTIRGDLMATLIDLYDRREAGEIGRFERVVVETTGLADPAPIIQTMMQEPLVFKHYRLARIVTAVDAVNAMTTFDRQPEAIKQAAVADALLVTKTDMANDRLALTALDSRLRRLNPSAVRARCVDGAVDPETLFNGGIYDPAGKTADVEGWLAASSAWSGLAPSMYSPKSQGKSFLMTTKLVAYLRNSFATLPGGSASFDAANPPFDKSKTSEWVSYAEGFTTGTLSGDAARAAFARATWGNYDKRAPLNRFGLCAFGETGGTKALGVDCDGY